MLTLEQVLGAPEAGRDLFGQHPLGRILRARTDIFRQQDAKYLLKHVRFQVGQAFSVKYGAMSQGLKSHKLSEENTGTVVTVPAKFAPFLKPQPAGIKLFQRFNLWRQSRALAVGLNAALNAYRAELLGAKDPFEAEEEGIMASELGGKVEPLTTEALKAKGMPLRQFLKPVGGRHIGVAGAQLGMLLESFRMALHPESMTLWQAIQPQVDFLLKDGQVRSSALLVQALMTTSISSIKDAQLARIVAGLQNNILDAQRTQDADHISLEVQFAAELINRSQLGNLPNLQELTQPLEKPAAGALVDNMVLLGVLSEARTMAALLAVDAAKNHADANNLRALLTILISGAEGSAQNDQLRQMLARTALPEEKLSATLVGEDVSKYVGSVITGRVEVKEVRYNGKQTCTVAVPVVGNVFANSEQAIQSLAQSQQGMSLSWYQGQLPEVLEVQAGYQSQVARHLEKNPLFQAHLINHSALAQAYAQWAKDKTSVNIQQIARVGIRMMKYYARQMEKGDLKQADYDAALEALNSLFAHSGIFEGQKIGQLGALEVFAPKSLSTGGQWALSWLWSKHSNGDNFNLNDDMEKSQREQRLRHFQSAQNAA